MCERKVIGVSLLFFAFILLTTCQLQLNKAGQWVYPTSINSGKRFRRNKKYPHPCLEREGPVGWD